MKFGSLLAVSFIVFSLLLCGVEPARAANLGIYPGGSGTFLIQATGLDGVAGLDITVTYDSKTLGIPTVEKGGGIPGDALFMPNAATAGVVRIAIIRVEPMSGSGTVAVLKFPLKGTSTGKILSFNATVINSTGSSLPVSPEVVNPTVAETTTDSKTTDSSTTASVTTGSTTTTSTTTHGATTLGLGGVTMPTDGTTPKEKAKSETMPPEPSSMEHAPRLEPADEEEHLEQQPAPAPAPEATDPAEKKYVAHRGVVNRFREFTGEKTPKSLMALFAGEVAPGFRQEPAIALSDGKTPLKVYLELKQKESSAPNFALKGAKLKSLKKDAEGVWMIEALPEAKVSTVVLTVLFDGRMVEYSLTVAMPMDAGIASGGQLKETDFALFLKEKGTEKVPRFDLNGDGKRDYLDDYIFTANYLVHQSRLQKPKAKETKK